MSRPRKIYITLAELQDARPCGRGYRQLMEGIEFDATADEVIIPLDLILAVNGPDDALWAYYRVYLWGAVQRASTYEETRKAIAAADDELDALWDKYPLTNNELGTWKEDLQERRVVREFLKGKKRA